VYLAIHLHNYSRGVAIEVDDESIDHLLAAEVQTMQPVAAQLVPQQSLRIGHMPAQLLCTLDLCGSDSLANHNVAGGHRNLTP
jgi:hypothetical protein